MRCDGEVPNGLIRSAIAKFDRRTPWNRNISSVQLFTSEFLIIPRSQGRNLIENLPYLYAVSSIVGIPQKQKMPSSSEAFLAGWNFKKQRGEMDTTSPCIDLQTLAVQYLHNTVQYSSLQLRDVARSKWLIEQPVEHTPGWLSSSETTTLSRGFPVALIYASLISSVMQ